MSGTHTPLQSGSEDDGRAHAEAIKAAAKHTNTACLSPILFPANILASLTAADGKFAQATADTSSADIQNMKRLLVLVFVLFVTASWVNADAGCGLVFGSDWAFAFSTPARWVSQCHAEKAVGAALALWPHGTTFSGAPAVMSVTVNEKRRQSLALFAAGDQQRRRSDTPNATVRFEPGMSVGGRPGALVFRASGDRNHELIAYVEAPTRFFVVTVSARNSRSLDESKGAFQLLLNSFVPMKVTAR